MTDVAEEGGPAETAAVDGGVTSRSGRVVANERNRSARWAAWTLAVVVVLAVPLILYQGRDQWFTDDDWDFLSRRSAGSFHDLMAPHSQHWTTFGILIYRALWWLDGINHYWPYQLSLVSLHVSAALLLRCVMRRAGVNPWIATAAASLFILFGAGRQDILFAFQITFTGALTFGLAHLLLADHPGPFDRRDLIGVGFGLVALMCSAVGVTMALAVGIAVLVRRGWRLALAHTAPLATAYLLWSATFGRDVYGGQRASLASLTAFVREVFISVFDGFGQVPSIGILLAVVIVVGVPLTLTQQTWEAFRRFDGPTLGLALAAVSFVVTTAYGRAVRPGVHAFATRYVYIVAALLLPTVALAASAFVDRWPLALPAAIAILLVGLPSNVAKLHAHGSESFTLGQPNLVLSMARLPLAREVPRDLSPPLYGGWTFTIGWLVDGVASGRVPEPSKAGPSNIATAELLLSVYQTTGRPRGSCVPIESDTPVQVRPGDAVEITGASVTFLRRIDLRTVAESSFFFFGGRTLRIVGAPLELVVHTTPSDEPAELCR